MTPTVRLILICSALLALGTSPGRAQDGPTPTVSPTPTPVTSPSPELSPKESSSPSPEAVTATPTPAPSPKRVHGVRPERPAQHPFRSPLPLPSPASPSDSLPSPSASPVAPPSPPTNLERAVIRLGDTPLFELQSLGDLTANERVTLLSKRLHQLLSRNVLGPISVEVKPYENTRVLICDGIYLVTVTETDATRAGVDINTLAGDWGDTLEQALNARLAEGYLSSLKSGIPKAVLALLLGLAVHALISPLSRRLLDAPGLPFKTALWLLVSTYVLWLFPYSRSVATTVYNYGFRPLATLIAVVLGCWLSRALANRVLRYYFGQLERHHEAAPIQRPRWRQRLYTLRESCGFLIQFCITVIGGVTYFSLLEVNLGTIITGAGFLGVGLGLAAQDLLKDWIAGLNIVMEDQFGPGDYITTNTCEGIVEHFTLRITQLRDTDGGLITIPNSQIHIVRNSSNLWGQVDLRMGIAHQSDVRLAIEVMTSTALALYRDWPDKVLGEPQVLGVDSIDNQGVVLRLLQRTEPLKQFLVRRELYLRIKEAFQKAGIDVPMARAQIHIHPNSPPPGEPPPLA